MTELQQAGLEPLLIELRGRLEAAFSPETAAPGFSGHAPSTGQCAAVSALVSKLLGAGMVSTKLKDQSHWFNRLRIGDHEYDFDLTGDQYGFQPVQYAEADKLYPGTRVRLYEDLNAETIGRAKLLATKAGLSEVAESL